MSCGWGQMKRAAYLRAAFAPDGLSGRPEDGGQLSDCAQGYVRAQKAIASQLDAVGCCESMGFHAPIGQYGGDLVHAF